MELHAQIACAMPRELSRKGIGWQNRAVYTEAIYYGRENLTDGVLSRGELGFWMPDMPTREKVRRLDSLRDAGALLDHEAGWQFPDHVWRKWNPTRAQVDEKRETERKRKEDWRDRQRHATSPSKNVPTGQDVTATTRDRQPEPEPEPEPLSVRPDSNTKLAADIDAYRHKRQTDPIWDALVASFGDVSTPAEKKNRGRQVGELKQAGATPDDIATRVGEHKRRNLNWTLTANALVTHWTELAPRTSEPRVINGAVMSEHYR